jgi:glutamine---fructose-6-phosphate transaminase (isomerizing)
MMEEIEGIPEAARVCLKKNRDIKLPENVPYLGMGASYYAAVTLCDIGKHIQPYVASTYYGYVERKKKPLGVLISQSGESSEVLWNLDRFEEVIAITNNPESQLAKAANCRQVIEVHAGKEEFMSTKTYFNTLVVLYLGLGINPEEAIKMVESKFLAYKKEAKDLALEIAEYMKSRKIKGLFVLGSGPNAATAQEGALTLSESTKFAWNGLPVAQYDHGPKETAKDSVVLFLQSNGRDKERIVSLKKFLEDNSNALVREIAAKDVQEDFSPFLHIVQLNLLMAFLGEALGEQEDFLGEKVTKVSGSEKFR